jgi:hypothetical protein
LLYVPFMVLFYPRAQHKDIDYETGFVLKLLEILILVCVFNKLLYFLRIFEQFGFLVQMVAKTCVRTIPFSVFFVLWIFFFTFAF